MQKTQNHKYLFNELSCGDRFYFFADRKKTVFEVCEIISHLDKPVEIKVMKDEQKFPDRYSGSELFKEVVFLRKIKDLLL